MSADKSEKAVRESILGWLAAFNAKDIEKLKTYYDPESYYANAAAPMTHGIEQIMTWYAQAFSMVDGTLLFKEEFLMQEEAMALLVGKYFFKPPTDTQDTIGEQSTGRVALVYRRSSDNRWLLMFDMDNMPPDVSPADFA